MSGLSLIEKDLRNALKWLKRAEMIARNSLPSDGTHTHVAATDREAFDDVKAFFVAALTFYAKAFTEANGRKAQMQRDWLKKEFRAIHDHYMGLRHNFAAHSGDMKIEDTSTHVLLIPDAGGYRVRLHTNRMQPDIAFHEENGKDFSMLIEHAIEVITQRSSDSSQKIGDAVMSKDLSYWLLASGTNEAINFDKIFNSVHKKTK